MYEKKARQCARRRGTYGLVAEQADQLELLLHALLEPTETAVDLPVAAATAPGRRLTQHRRRN